MEIAGSTFIVTGGASGLGEATTQLLVSRGANVVIADISPSGKALATKLGSAVAFIRTDVTQEEDGKAAVAMAKDNFSNLRGLVNCAGVAPSERIVGRAGAHSLETFTRAVMINLVGTFNMMRLAAEAMMSQDPLEDGERGVIINTASIAAYEGQIGQAAYAASKAGVAGLTLPAAREFAKTGIRVVAIAPGLFLTPMMSAFPQAVQDSLAQAVPFPARLGKPDEYAALVETIVKLPMLNGEVIRLDGALRMAPK